MASIWRSSFGCSVAFGMIAMLLAGCLAEPQPVPDRATATATLRPTLNTPPSFQMPATPSPTSFEPVKPAPSQTSTPVTIPVSQIALPYDLLFLSGDRLMRWSHIRNKASPMVIDVVGYSASQVGSKIAVMRSTGKTANADETFDLTVLDTRNGDFVTLLDSIPRLTAFQISPDGHWIALMNHLQQLYLLPSDGSDKGARIGVCQSSQAGDCNDLAWSADSLAVIWDTADGIWQAGPDRLTPSLAISNRLDIADPKGQLTRKQVQFHRLEWSPLGRYVLTHIQPLGSDVSWQAIIDTSTQRMAEIPASYQVDEPTALSFWLNDGNLLVVHRAPKEQIQPVSLESWQILPTRADLMSLNFRWEISSDQLEGPSNNQLWYELPVIASQVDDRTLSMAVNSSDLDGPSQLFTFDIKYGILNKIADLPSQVVNISWTPDGNAALVMDSDGDLIYVPANGNGRSDLTAHFGRQSCCYTWLADETALP